LRSFLKMKKSCRFDERRSSWMLSNTEKAINKDLGKQLDNYKQ